LIGLPRPQTARDILRDATTLGVTAMHFVRTDRGEASYGQSSLWHSGEWESCLVTGAAQAFCTHLPEVTHGRDLAAVISGLGMGSSRLALDNYEASAPLADIPLAGTGSVMLAIGPERGWSEAERTLLREQKFTLVHLGARVLRAETACTAAIAIIKAKCGWF
jgi:RsmE family RNA methyltransferase